MSVEKTKGGIVTMDRVLDKTEYSLLSAILLSSQKVHCFGVGEDHIIFSERHVEDLGGKRSCLD